MGKILTNFESLSQPDELDGKPDQPIHLIQFAGTAVWVFGVVCIGSQSFGVGFLLDLFFWIPDSQRKVLKKFESLSQPAELVGRPDHLVHWVQFSGMEVWVLCFVFSVLSHSVSELYTVCIFWFPYSVRNVLKNFQNCSQPNRPIGGLDQPVFRVL